MYKDKSGIFKDFNFKLVVLNSLLEKETSFSEELENIISLCDECDDEINMNAIDFFQNIELSEKDLESVTKLVFDAGEDIYFLICPDWDGEDDMFDVKCIDGIEKLTKLEEVEYISLASDDLVREIEKQGINIV